MRAVALVTLLVTIALVHAQTQWFDCPVFTDKFVKTNETVDGKVIYSIF